MTPLRLPLALVRDTTAPILVGPWRSELGFEVLYWVPYLRAWARRRGVAWDRLVPVTRGGMAAWYGVPRGVELYGLRAPAQVWREQRRGQIEHQTLKQWHRWIPAWDRAVLVDAAMSLGVGTYHVLHPARMYRRLTRVWRERRGLSDILRVCMYPADRPLVPVMERHPGVPAGRYVAVRWYDRWTFGLDEGVVAWARRLVDDIAKRTPVVSVELTQDVDDHQDLPLRGPHITSIRLTDPETSLWDCGRVLRHAAAYVGTYGAVAQWALLLGVPSVSFYTRWGGTCDAHLGWSGYLARRWGVPFEVGHISQPAKLRAVRGEVGV